MSSGDRNASGLRRRSVEANGIEFGILEVGSGPLALCLHGFPDSAHTWRYLLPELAQLGFRAVAPFMRGYAPTGLAPNGAYQFGALVADVIALHDALGGDERAVLIGNDWGAEAAYGAASLAPERWRLLVTIAVPPLALDERLFSDYDQLKRFFYLFFMKTKRAESVLALGPIPIGRASRAACARLKAIRPLASCRRARWFSSFFDQRMRMPRLRLSHEWQASTTQRRAASRGCAA